jgi:hypothetical protein
VSRKNFKFKFSFIVVTALVAILGTGTLIALDRYTSNADYWLSGIGLVLPLVAAAAGKVLHPVRQQSASELDGQQEYLCGIVRRQWHEELDRWIPAYPLPVPFSEASTVRISGDDVGVMDSWTAILRDPDRVPPRLAGTFDEIARIFRGDGMPGRLIILGEPGSGKSTLAQSLAVTLSRPGPDPGADDRLPPVPVVLPLADWDPAVPLRDWAAEEMTSSYPWLGASTQMREGSAETLAARLIDQGRILLILDGLDEIPERSRPAAFGRLSAAARKNRAMVITCRREEYGRLVQANGLLPRTPVITLHPLPAAAVRTYLAKGVSEEISSRFSQIEGEIGRHPEGELSQALSSPFALWLLTAAGGYQSLADRIIQSPDREQVMAHLLDAIVPAVYATDYPTETGAGLPARGREEVSIAQDRLARIARHLRDGPGSRQDIDWWRLSDLVPRPVLGGVIGLPLGCLVGAAAGVATAVRYSQHAGVITGAIVGIIVCAFTGIAQVQRPTTPHMVDLHFGWSTWRFAGCLAAGAVVGFTFAYADQQGGGLVPALITTVLVWPVSAIPCAVALSWEAGIEAGFGASILFGLASGILRGNGHPLGSGIAVGLVFAVSGWIFVGLYQPTRDRFTAGPRTQLDRDRASVLTVACAGGIMAAVVYGIALGPVIGIVALVALTVATAGMVSRWATFCVARIWLRLADGFPLTLMGFLDEACARGALRQTGSSYQFRHPDLQTALTGNAPAGIPLAGEAGREQAPLGVR